MIWNIIEITFTFIQIYIFLKFLVNFFELKSKNNINIIFFYITLIVTSGGVITINLLHVVSIWEFFIFCLPMFTFSLLLLKGNTLKKIFIIVIMYAIMGVVATSLMYLLVNIEKSNFQNILQKQSLFRLILLFLSNIITMYFSKIIIKFKEKQSHIKKTDIILLLITPISTNIFLFYLFSFILKNDISSLSKSLIYSILLLASICIVQSFWLYFKMSKEYEKDLRYFIIHEKYKLQLQNSDEISNLYKETAQIKHDLKNHLAIIVGHINNGNYEKSLSYIDKISKEKVSDNIYVEYCKNEYVNYIVNQKAKICRNKNIEFKISIDIFWKLMRISN